MKPTPTQVESSPLFISIKLIDGFYSIDISTNKHTGGMCRRFRWIDDGEIWIKEETGKDIPGNWPNLNQRDFSKLGEFKSWDEATWREKVESLHTPGPWTFTPSKQIDHGRGMKTWLGCEVTDATNHRNICLAPHATTPEQWEANARLIAAAPCLLSALIELVERAEAEGNIDGLPEYEQARAAIARAMSSPKRDSSRMNSRLS